MAYEMELPFDTDSPEFVRGFEAGCIWTLMDKSPESLNGMMIHASNAEMVWRMIEKKGLDLKAHFTDEEGWMMLDE